MQNLLLKNKKSYPKNTKPLNRDSNSIMTNLIRDDLKLVNNFMITNIKSEVPLIPLLSEYLINSGGKRIRPLLTLAVAKLCGYAGSRHLIL